MTQAATALTRTDSSLVRFRVIFLICFLVFIVSPQVRLHHPT